MKLRSGAGACTAYDVVLFLKRDGADFDAVEVHLDAERGDTDPKVFRRVDYTYTVKGRGLNAERVREIVHLSAEKYSSATAMFAQTARIGIEVVVIDTAT